MLGAPNGSCFSASITKKVGDVSAKNLYEVRVAPPRTPRSVTPDVSFAGGASPTFLVKVGLSISI